MIVTDAVRKAAADLCAAKADWWACRPASICPTAMTGDAYSLSEAAISSVYDAMPHLSVVDGYRRAESMLREGWNPGDDVDICDDLYPVDSIYFRKVSP